MLSTTRSWADTHRMPMVATSSPSTTSARALATVPTIPDLDDGPTSMNK
jgi:hypothetical protein